MNALLLLYILTAGVLYAGSTEPLAITGIEPSDITEPEAKNEPFINWKKYKILGIGSPLPAISPGRTEDGVKDLIESRKAEGELSARYRTSQARWNLHGNN